jgi:repressor LexA
MTKGERIKKVRESLGISQTELAEKVSSTKQNIYKYENDIITNIPSDKIEAIAEALHTTPAYLMGWEEKLDPGPHPASDDPQPLPVKRIPILGRIAAGVPIYAEENIEGYTYTTLNGGSEYFGLRVRGDSMDAARINDGDVVIVRRQDVVENGQIAVCLINGEDATLKRFSQNGHIVTLMPQSTNPAHKPFVYDLQETSVEILGLVVKVEFSPR